MAQPRRSSWRQLEDPFIARGISFEELAERVGHPEADPFDLLVFVAWNGPAVSRRDRANRLRRDDAAFLDRFVPEARAILEELLEKYAEHGVGHSRPPYIRGAAAHRFQARRSRLPSGSAGQTSYGRPSFLAELLYST